jgi:predicted transcriptional regulator
MFADIRKNVQKYFSEITLRRLRENLKSFKGTGGLAQPIVYSKVADTVFNGIQRLREAGVGHLVVTEKDSLATTVGVISKKDILVYMIKNFTTDTKIDVLLNEKVGKLEIGTLGNKVVCCSKNETLRRVLQEMARLKVSCIPITDENKIYQGAIVKGHVEMILREASLHLVANS